MKIMNLGPIKEFEFKLNKLTILIGKNGTGKTLTTYTAYALSVWIREKFSVDIVNEDTIKCIIKNGFYKLNVTEVYNYIVDKATKEFNGVDNSFFKFFFNDESIITDRTAISASKDDIKSCLKSLESLDNFDFAGLIWKYVGERDNEKSNKEANKNYLNVEYDKKTVNLIYSRGSLDREIDQASSMQDREKQFNRIKTAAMIRMLNDNILNAYVPKNRVYLPAERIGINVFRNELTSARAEKFSDLTSTVETKVNPNEELALNYPRPIDDYFRFLNRTIPLNSNLYRYIDGFGIQDNKNKYFEGLKKIRSSRNAIIPGEYEYNPDNNSITFKTKASGRAISFNLLSSSLKSLFGIDWFLRNMRHGDLLFIDEPEMNLHPEKQVKIAELMLALIDIGVRVIVSTHSDYFIKAVINLLLERKLYEKESYSKNTDVYLLKNGHGEKIGDLTEEENVNLANFDDSSITLNNEYFDLMEKLEND